MRKPMVTRTILTTKVNVLCADTVRCEMENKSLVLPRTYKDNEKMLKAVREAIDSETMKAVQIVDSEIVETLYGLDESTFIKYAVELDPKTRRPYGEEAELEEAELEE